MKEQTLVSGSQTCVRSASGSLKMMVLRWVHLTERTGRLLQTAIVTFSRRLCSTEFCPARVFCGVVGGLLKS